MADCLTLPRRSRGRQSTEAEDAYQESLENFCTQILQIRSRLDFKVSARGEPEPVAGNDRAGCRIEIQRR